MEFSFHVNSFMDDLLLKLEKQGIFSSLLSVLSASAFVNNIRRHFVILPLIRMNLWVRKDEGGMIFFFFF